MKKTVINALITVALLMYSFINFLPTNVLAGKGDPVKAPVSAQSVIQNYLDITFNACSTTEVTGIFCIIGKLVIYLMGIVGIISVILMVVGGLQYMASGGDEKSITAAKSILTYAVLGLFIVILASLIVSTVLTAFDISPSP